MILKIYPDNPNPKRIQEVADILRNGGIVIYPTDTVYSIGCDLMNQKAIAKVAAIKGIKPEKANFSIICYDLSHISEYAKVNTPDYKLLKKSLPGAFTFILNATGNVPKIFKSKKKTIGIRVPNNNIAREIVLEFGNPIIATSVHDDDEILEYTTDPELIHEKYGKLVDVVIDGGMGNNEASTIVDLTDGEPEIIRQGLGELEY
ncbi:MAG: tRNA threonylcarbamoyl adenosine modification protein (Sua5/YciO/YrdC/YwlC family) [Cryomorphaceae bacterium]|jgi:tRNA threonylcarbamoyl adenosine modification protein (Sua5/YciO/YrdC/YwlC family)